jgi:hypothetical protein
MWGGMMSGGMMGSGSGIGTASSPYLWMIPFGLIALVVAAVAGISFYLVLPEIRTSQGTCVPSPTGHIQGTLGTRGDTSNTVTKSVSNSNACDVLLRTMTPEEQKVLNALRAHQGKYLQKYIGKEAGLNRLKTHRILARFAQRGIVTAKQFGNTNEISLSDWVQTSKTQQAN